MRSAIVLLMEKITYSNHQTTETHTQMGEYVLYVLSNTRSLSQRHTDVLLRGCHDNYLKFPIGQDECESLCVCGKCNRVVI